MPKLTKDYNLAALFPEIAKEWHPMKNRNINPEDCYPKSNKKVWWICEKGHEWNAVIDKRTTRGQGCPYCSHNPRVGYGNDLGSREPELAKEWHPTKNGDLTVDNITPKSNKKVWWICEKGHEWKSSPGARKGCPYCYGNKVGYGNDLASKYPELIKEWHPTKNGSLIPSDFYYKSTIKVWWLCKAGHEWETSIRKRSSYNKTRCPYCSIQTSQPELFFYCELKSIFNDVVHRYKIDGIEVDIYVKDLNLCIEYDGVRFHKNKKDTDKEKKLKLISKGYDTINVREENLKKIFSQDLIIKPHTDFYKTFIEFLKHLLKQNILNRKQEMKINDYLKTGEKRNEKMFLSLLSLLPGPLPGTSMEDRFPKLSKEWHPTKNGKLDLKNVMPFSNKKVWWICEKGHEWENSPNKRSHGSTCPYCLNRKVGYGNDFATTFPELAKEWHPNKNGNLKPNQIVGGSGRKVWWLCDKKHEWEALIRSRTSLGTGCPVCYKNSRKTNT